jgi:hypothetical protein
MRIARKTETGASAHTVLRQRYSRTDLFNAKENSVRGLVEFRCSTHRTHHFERIGNYRLNASRATGGGDNRNVFATLMAVEADVPTGARSFIHNPLAPFLAMHELRAVAERSRAIGAIRSASNFLRCSASTHPYMHGKPSLYGPKASDIRSSTRTLRGAVEMGCHGIRCRLVIVARHSRGRPHRGSME